MLLAISGSALAWGEPHHAITKAAVEVLPGWQREALGKEAEGLSSYYCIIPDRVFADKANLKFAMIEGNPTVYLKNLHLPAGQAEDLATLRYFMGKAVESLKAGKVDEAARYMGSVCHQLEDYGSPAHTMPGDNMFTLLQQFMPAPEEMRGVLMHGPIENGKFAVSIAGYKPRLLGTGVDEAAWRALHRDHEAIINARGTTVEIMRAVYAKDDAAKEAAQMRAAVFDAQVVADVMHTIMCLGTGKFEAGEEAELRSVSLAGKWPIEAVNLYFAQPEFSGTPVWGPARFGVTVDADSKEHPLLLPPEAKKIERGISVVMGKTLTYPLPVGVYGRFKAVVGLHAELGVKGKVTFGVIGDGKPLATVTVGGGEPAKEVDVEIGGVKELGLTATSAKGGDVKANFAIWGEPRVEKR